MDAGSLWSAHSEDTVDLKAQIEAGDAATLAAAKKYTDQEIADATLLLLHNPEYARQLARNARALVETRYTWERMFEALDQTIAEIVPKPD